MALVQGSKFTGSQPSAPRLTNRRGIADVTTGCQLEDRGAHGQAFGWTDIDELVTFASTATVDTTAVIPAGTVRVDLGLTIGTALSGASVSTFIVGIAGATNRFVATGGAVAAGTMAVGSSSNNYTSDTAIRVTPDTSATAGTMRIVARCYFVTPPSS